MGAFNVMELKVKHSKWVLRSHGLGTRVVELENGSTVHCWVPAHWSNNGENVATTLKLKPALLLLHGFGMDGTMNWEQQVASLAKKFSLVIPDLLFFGKSRTSNKQRSEVFQAECMFTLMEKLGILQTDGFVVCGHSYGGFVAYRMAHLYPSFVKRVVIMSSGIMMDSMTNNLPLLQTFGASGIEDFLIPRSALDFQKGLAFVFHKLPRLPFFVFKDIFEILSGNQQERHELIEGTIIGRKNASPLPKLNQDVLIIWGEHDKVFNLDLAYSLKNFLGDNATLALIKDAGHMPQMEKPKDVNLAISKFLTS